MRETPKGQHGSPHPSLETPSARRTGLAALPAGVVDVGTEVLSADQLENTERLTRLRDDSWALREAIDSWKAQRDSERSLRRIYANVMLIVLCVETVFAATMFVLIGTSVLRLEQWVCNTFFVTVFGQVSAGVVAITKYLFPSNAYDTFPLELIKIQKGAARSANKRGRYGD